MARPCKAWRECVEDDMQKFVKVTKLKLMVRCLESRLRVGVEIIGITLKEWNSEEWSDPHLHG